MTLSVARRTAQRDAVPPRTTLVEVAAGWSLKHPILAIAGWVALVVMCVVGGNLAGLNSADDAQLGPGEAGRAAAMIQAAGLQGHDTESVLITARSGHPDASGHEGRSRRHQAGIGQAPDGRRSGQADAVWRPGRDARPGDRGRGRRRRETPATGGLRPTHPVPGGRRGPDRRVDHRCRCQRPTRSGLRFRTHPQPAHHHPDPAVRLRRAAGGRGAGAVGCRLGAGRRRAVHRGLARLSRRRLDGRAHPADRHGGRRRLLVVLPQTRAGGATGRPL